MQIKQLSKKTETSAIQSKIVKVMKLHVLFLLVFSVHVFAKSGAQQVTLNFKNASLDKVIFEVSKQSGFQFLYNEKIIKKSKPITINVSNIDITVALNKIFQSSGLNYSITDKTIVVTENNQSITQPANPVMQIQQQVVSGIVSNENNQPLSNVSVINQTTKKGTATATDGSFSIEANRNDVLSFSFIGYEITKVKITTQFIGLQITLKTSVAELNETVVIGYGTAKKKDLTGSVSIVNAKDIQDVPFMTVDNAIAGKAAGVQVTKSDGTPGGAVRIRIRGSSSLLGGNDPLYIIDGVPVQVKSNYINPGFDVSSPVGNDVTGQGGAANGMSAAFVNGLNSIGGLNVDDIESITILKDASSTAIYGSKAANGVVIITTKRGKKDMKPQIIFDYSGTFSQIINKPDLLNATQYKMLLTEAAQNDYDYRTAVGRDIPGDVKAILNSPQTYFGKANTDWVGLVTRNVFAHDAQISVQGGGSATKYYSSVAFNSTPGVVIGTDYKRVAGKLNIENEIGSKFTFNTNLDIGFTNQDISNGVYGQAVRSRPDYVPYDSLGKFTSFDNVGESYQGFINPLAMATSINNSKNFSLLGSLSALYDITKGLQFKSIVSLNMQMYNQRNYTPSYIAIGSYYGNVANNGGIGSVSNTQSSNWFVENTLTYDRTFNEKHSLNVLAGTSYETLKQSFSLATATGYPNDDVLNNLSSAVTPLITQGDNPTRPQSYLLSFYLRANYAFMDKYLVTFTGRADGSSKFGPDNKFGYFPSGALAWRISKENFLKNVDWISDIKLRGSYGLTGTQNIGNQMYRTLYTPYSYGGGSALVPTQLGNPAVKWEETKETDLGLDFSFFKNRLQGTADYYHKQTSGVLISLPVAPSSSYASLLDNVAGIRNRGFELSLQGDIIRTKNFRWNASINITWNKSLVTELNPDVDLTQIGNLTGLEYQNIAIVQGQPLGIITGMNVTGIIKTQKELDDYKSKLGLFSGNFDYLSIGDPMFELDTVTYAAYGAAYPSFHSIIGHAAPKYYGGFTQGFSYKNWDLNFYFTFSQGGQLMWGDHVSSLAFVGTSNANAVMLNRYTPQNTNTNQPRLLLNDQLLYNSNLSVFNSSYVKLRTLTLNYRFNQNGFLKKAGVKNAAVYLSATNVFTLAKYPGNNPETSDDPYSVGGGYFDVSNYPNVTTITAGLKIGF